MNWQGEVGIIIALCRIIMSIPLLEDGVTYLHAVYLHPELDILFIFADVIAIEIEFHLIISLDKGRVLPVCLCNIFSCFIIVKVSLWLIVIKVHYLITNRNIILKY